MFLTKFQLATLGRRSEAISITSPVLLDLRKKSKNISGFKSYYFRLYLCGSILSELEVLHDKN